MNDACIFCRIVAGSIPATVVASNEQALAFKDLHPQAPVHVLVIPRRHVASLATADDPAELGAVMALAAQVARDAGLPASGYRVVTNIGNDGGQTVGHLHLHVLGGRAFSWPPG
ncbi:histidine triad nucleotide-binding protein [Gemmatimonas sp.]|jgi:histidine triad (HIT) family protein|uniref:histidine triad nucleotide-binding protein n=1 Tax=Gemmatimonas sp. TaxID=1962908 RepID=UPI0037BF8C0E